MAINEGADTNRHYLINKYTQTGTFEWTSKIVTSSSPNYINSAIQNNGSLVIVDAKFHAFIDSSGNIGQQVTLNSTTTYLSADIQPDYFVTFQRISSGATAGIYINKKNDQGTNIWETKIPMNDSAFTGVVSVNKNGNIFAAIKLPTPTGGPHGPRIIKLNTSGEILHNAVHDLRDLIGSPETNSAFFYGIYADENENVIVSGLANFKLLNISFDPDFQIKTSQLFSDFEAGQSYIYGRDGYFYLKNKLLFGGNQRNLNEAGYDLVLTKINMDSQVEWTQFEKKQANSKIIVNEADIDSAGNTYFATNSAGKFKVIKQGKDGNVIWEKFFYENITGVATGVKVLPNGTINVVGQLTDPLLVYRNLLINLNPDGTQNWETLHVHPGLPDLKIQGL